MVVDTRRNTEVNRHVGRCDNIEKREKGEIHLRCTVLKTKTRHETIRRVKVATKSPRKGVDTCGYFAPRDLYIYLTLNITK